mmetsp:Transcript_1852/g.2316  ORF Transcript_1852/g.2316 Transcript_1852/m.2316 type:complete len:96 (+) Transcript_1852:186-473(+)
MLLICKDYFSVKVPCTDVCRFVVTQIFDIGCSYGIDFILCWFRFNVGSTRRGVFIKSVHDMILFYSILVGAYFVTRLFLGVRRLDHRTGVREKML